ncbi:MAG: ABC transporter permease [Chthonomonas sp.]|nr:ABC transporter permease [Chthonomonas sp.]
MNSSWINVRRLLAKEFRTEFRSPTNLWTALILNSACATALGLAANREFPGRELLAGMLVALLIFSAVSVLPRLIIAEGDQGTYDFLRLHFQPEEIFWGKFLYAALVQFAGGVLITTILVGMSGRPVEQAAFLLLGVLLETLCFAGTLILCGCFALGASARWTLAGMLAIPLLLPQSIAGQGVFRHAFGAGLPSTAWVNVGALAGYVLVLVAVGPPLCRAVSSLGADK